MLKEAWVAWEEEVQDRLGLDSTICSGSKWNDVGDATDNSSPQDNDFRLLVDCKHSTARSYSVLASFMGQWVDKAEQVGKRFILALRMHPRGAQSSRDYVMLTMDDFEELLAKSRKCEDIERGYIKLPQDFDWREHNRIVSGPNFSGWGDGI